MLISDFMVIKDHNDRELLLRIDQVTKVVPFRDGSFIHVKYGDRIQSNTSVEEIINIFKSQ